MSQNTGSAGALARTERAARKGFWRNNVLRKLSSGRGAPRSP